MQKGVNENEFFYFTGDFGLIKEKVTEITDRIIRRTVGTTLADFFAVSVCPVSFGLLPFQYWFAGFGPLSRYSSPRNSTTQILYGIPGVIFLLLFSAGWKFPFRSSGIRIRPVLLHVSDNSGSVPARDGCVNGSDNRFFMVRYKKFFRCYSLWTDCRFSIKRTKTSWTMPRAVSSSCTYRKAK